MKQFVFLITLTIFDGLLMNSQAIRCRRGVRSCLVNDPTTGLSNLQEYNGCTHFCCGAAILEREGNLECCGDESEGAPFRPNTQFCCAWRFGGEFAVHDKDNLAAGAFCCGTDVFEPGEETANQTCCNGYQNRPEIFNYMTEMCCNGNRAFSGDTAYTSCCGDTSYDRRVASCPCHNGEIGVGIPEEEAACCHNRGRTTAVAYNTLTASCCGGELCDVETQFCCGNIIGEKATQTCCGDVIIERSSEFDDVEVACCATDSGENEIFNPSTSVCCHGSVLPKDPEDEVICCGETLHTVGESGDACCGDEPYSTSSSVCCDGETQTHNFTKPSCCHNQTFDSYVSTCCGLTVFENPIVLDLEGEFVTSHHTRCCGDFGNDETLIPYDYLSQACCSGIIIELGLTPFDAVECCGIGIMETSTQICCDGTIVDNVFGETGSCCGNTAINSTMSVCCDGVSHSNEGLENASCCGNVLMDPSEAICCDNVPRSLNGVSPENAICCGDRCVDGATFWCCDGKQFQKGADSGEAISGLSCNDLFG